MTDLTEQQQKSIEDYLEGRIQGEDLLRVEKWLEENPSGRDYLQFLKKLKDLSPSASLVVPPAHLVDKIMDRVPVSRRQMTAPFPWVKPGLALACMVLALFAGLRWFHSFRTSSLDISFILNAPGARQVELAGDFTGWKKISLKQDERRWKVRIPVSTGKDYQYAFILNGRVLVMDPANDSVVRDKHGDFYSVLRLPGRQTRESIGMKQTAFLKPMGIILTSFLSLCSVSSAFADTVVSPEFQEKFKSEVHEAVLSPGEARKVLEQANRLASKGVPEATLEDVLHQSLVLGKASAAEKALNRLDLLVSQGLASEDAGKVSIKEIREEVKAIEKTQPEDEEMEKSLEKGLANLPAAGTQALTQDQLEKKLELKQREWEEQMEQEKEIRYIQHEASERAP